MILRELFFADPDIKSVSNDMRYDPSDDDSIMKRHDTRKTRLTLKNINQLRKQSEFHILEQDKELEFIEKMYKVPAAPM